MRVQALLSLLAATATIAAPGRKRDVTTTTTTATAYITETAHVTVTDTAYIIAELPPCASTASLDAITTVQPVGPSASQSSSSSGTGSGNSSGGSSSGVTTGSGSSGTSSSGTSSSTTSSGGDSGSNPLVPVQPSNVDPNSPSTLQPSTNGSVSWQQNATDPSAPYVFAEANVTYQFPTVVLPHSALVSSVACVSDGLAITFADSTAYKYVEANWNTYNGQGFLLVADWQPCMGGSEADKGGHVYYLVTGLSYNDATMTVHATAREIEIQNALGQVDLQWGTYDPSGGSSSLPYGSDPNSGSDDGSSSSGSDGGDTYSPSGNGTALSCLNPEASYMGLPTAPCGYDFDTVLDEEIGYYDLAGSEADAEAFAPGYPINNETFVEPSALTKRGSIAKCRYNKDGTLRSGNIFCDKASSLALLKIKVTPQISPEEREELKRLEGELAKYAAQLKDTAKAGLVNGLSPKLQKTIAFQSAPKKLVDSKFGTKNSYLLYTGTKAKNSTTSNGKASAAINIYCVDCKVEGAATLAGYLSFNILKLSVDTATVGLYGNAYASAKLGIAVEASYSNSFNVPIFSAPIPNAGFTIKKLVTVGAMTKLAATGSIEINAEGQLLVGATASIPNFRAQLDAVGSQSGITGFTPVFNKTFEASGQISVVAGLGLPMSIGIELDIPLVKFKKELALVNTPSITASAMLKASSDYKDTADCNNGLKYSVNAKDAIDFRFADKVYPLGQVNKTLVEGCYTLPYAQNKTVQARLLSTSAARSYKRQLNSSSSSVDDSAVSTTVSNSGSSSSSGSSNSTAAMASATPVVNDVSSSAATSNSSASGAANTTSPVTPLSSSAVNASMTATADASTSTGNFTFDSIAEIQAIDDANVYNDTGVTGADDLNMFNQSIAAAEAADGEQDFSDIPYISVLDSTGSFVLANDDQGNFILDNASDSADWTYASQSGGVLVGDGDDLVFFYYPDEMSTLGVSRFRMNDINHVPKTAQSITLTPINYDSDSSTPGLYAAVDTEDNAYYLAICDITDLDSKIFLVKDIDTGIQTLVDPNLQSVITGGVVTSCVPLALQSSDAGF